MQTESTHQGVGAILVGHEENLLGLEWPKGWTRTLFSVWIMKWEATYTDCLERYVLKNIFQHVFDVLLWGIQAYRLV